MSPKPKSRLTIPHHRSGDGFGGGTAAPAWRVHKSLPPTATENLRVTVISRMPLGVVDGGVNPQQSGEI
jgi:hypothetical protein